MVAGIAVMAVGLLLSGGEADCDLLRIGVMLLILAPMVGIIVTAAALASERDWLWTRVAAVLICVIALVVAVSFLI